MPSARRGEPLGAAGHARRRRGVPGAEAQRRASGARPRNVRRAAPTRQSDAARRVPRPHRVPWPGTNSPSIQRLISSCPSPSRRRRRRHPRRCPVRAAAAAALVSRSEDAVRPVRAGAVRRRRLARSKAPSPRSQRAPPSPRSDPAGPCSRRRRRPCGAQQPHFVGATPPSRSSSCGARWAAPTWGAARRSPHAGGDRRAGGARRDEASLSLEAPPPVAALARAAARGRAAQSSLLNGQRLLGVSVGVGDRGRGRSDAAREARGATTTTHQNFLRALTHEPGVCVSSRKNTPRVVFWNIRGPRQRRDSGKDATARDAYAVSRGFRAHVPCFPLSPPRARTSPRSGRSPGASSSLRRSEASSTRAPGEGSRFQKPAARGLADAP